MQRRETRSPRVLTKTSVLLLGALLATSVPAAGTAHAEPQRVEGVVLAPLAWEGCTGFTSALLWTAARQDTAYRFSIDGETWGKPFVLDPALPADLDIQFLAGTSRIGYAGHRFGTVTGIVPKGATRARVCLYLGSPTTFTYTAG